MCPGKIHTPPHICMDNTIYFLSVHTYRGISVLASVARKDVLRRTIMREFAIGKYCIYAYVILDNHYHLLFKSAKGSNLPVLMRRIHGTLSFLWNKEDVMCGRKCFQSYFETIIRDKESFYLHLNYIHNNPVKHGYCNGIEAYAHSSIHSYMRFKGAEWITDCISRYPVRDYSPSGE